MNHAQMYARLVASDADFDGRFFTGVLTTGIYCLPSCKARKPKPDNVRFFPTCEAARATGLRPCLKCHPDDFARGADPVLETIESLVAEIRADPAQFSDARAVVRRSGFGSTRAFELFRRHYHATPADLLLNARIAKTQHHLLEGNGGIADVAFRAGFDSLSSFHENFRRITGLTPAAYRALPSAGSFTLALPPDYSVPHLRYALSRDHESVNEKLIEEMYVAAVMLSGGPAILRMHLSPTAVLIECPPGAAVEVHRIVTGFLGLAQDAPSFARLAGRLGFARLTAGREGLRISLTASLFEGMLWAILGQQINFEFACRLKRRLYELCGTPVAQGLIATPMPAAVARLQVADLLPLQFSRQKARYLIDTARAIVEGTLDLEALRDFSATRAERTLLAQRGLGPWSVNYLMMRSLGFADCLPLGDTGVTSGLQRLMHLEERPDADATRRLMSIFSPHRSLATAHLWQLLRTPA